MASLFEFNIQNMIHYNQILEALLKRLSCLTHISIQKLFKNFKLILNKYYSPVMMRKFQLSFNNLELEQEYQHEMLELAKKGYHQFLSIFMIAIGILILDQIIKHNIPMILWFLSNELTIISFLCISLRNPLFKNNLQYHYYLFNFMACIIQHNDQLIYLDMIQQYCLSAHANINHIGASLMIILFISSRVFVQMASGYSLSSLGYLVFSLYIFIDQYQKAKFRRKLFLKSNRNNQLKLLIEEFIDDQVSILEKDEENIRFNIIILNKKLSEITDQFSQFLQKEVKLPQYKSNLLDYLYATTLQQESFICNYKNQNYQITYQYFMLKKQQVFLKTKLLGQKSNEQIKYKELNKYLLDKMHFQPYKFYQGKHILKMIQTKSFYFLFSSYSQYYQVDLEKISFQFLKQILKQNKLQLLGQALIQPFYSDKKLIIILIHLLKMMIKDKLISIQKNQEFYIFEFNAKQNISESQIKEVNKVLFHIGFGQIEKSPQIDQQKMSLILLDKNGFGRFN
ncbi:hypothetical protein pb186bvf_013593 [Paramecium bursaria]